MAIFTTARPFLKWAGGKQQLLKQLKPFFPPVFGRYLEPFVGGGAVFFHLYNTKMLPETVILFDNNEELINAYRVVRDEVETLIAILAEHQRLHSREYYYGIRSLDRQLGLRLSDVERAARTIYLNRTCYNGLFRVNSKGQFNVPMGSYKNPRVLYEARLVSTSRALQGVDLEVKGFQNVLELAQKGDFIYFDPPYDPVSETANFTSYTTDVFDEDAQRKLADLYSQLSERGCLCMLSNSATPLILNLYREFRVELVQANRAINSKANGRGAINEVVVLNY